MIHPNFESRYPEQLSVINAMDLDDAIGYLLSTEEVEWYQVGSCRLA